MEDRVDVGVWEVEECLGNEGEDDCVVWVVGVVDWSGDKDKVTVDIDGN